MEKYKKCQLSLDILEYCKKKNHECSYFQDLYKKCLEKSKIKKIK